MCRGFHLGVSVYRWVCLDVYWRGPPFKFSPDRILAEQNEDKVSNYRKYRADRFPPLAAACFDGDVSFHFKPNSHPHTHTHNTGTHARRIFLFSGSTNFHLFFFFRFQHSFGITLEYTKHLINQPSSTHPRIRRTR